MQHSEYTQTSGMTTPLLLPAPAFASAVPLERRVTAPTVSAEVFMKVRRVKGFTAAILMTVG